MLALLVARLHLRGRRCPVHLLGGRGLAPFLSVRFAVVRRARQVAPRCALPQCSTPWRGCGTGQAVQPAVHPGGTWYSDRLVGGWTWATRDPLASGFGAGATPCA